MKILITGSSGLIGSALKIALESLQIDVVEFDISRSKDILDANLLFSEMEHVDGVVHLAAVSRVIDGEKKPKLCWKTNVEGTRNVAEAALASSKQPWVIYASSREVYGEQKELPVKESAPLRPVNIYGESKLEAENMIALAQAKGLTASIVRFSNVFGSVNDHPDRVVPAFCRAAAEGSNLRVDGSNNMFDFTYLEDVVQGVISLIRLLTRTKESLPPIHLTSGTGVTLGEIAQIAQEASYYPISIIEKPSRSFDVSRFYGDTSRAKAILNWQARVPVQEGMHRLINQFRIYFHSCKGVEVEKNLV